jgi:hypothetical protein
VQPSSAQKTSTAKRTQERIENKISLQFEPSSSQSPCGSQCRRPTPHDSTVVASLLVHPDAEKKSSHYKTNPGTS